MQHGRLDSVKTETGTDQQSIQKTRRANKNADRV